MENKQDSLSLFMSGRGLRQRDPISPAILVILAECLSRGLKKLFERGPALRYLYGEKTVVSRLCFADDILVYNNEQKKILRSVLKIYTKI